MIIVSVTPLEVRVKMLDYLKIKVFLMIVLKSFTYSCSCSNKSHVMSYYNQSNNIKRELDYEDYSVSTEPQNITDNINSTITTTLNDTIEVNKTIKFNETMIDIRKKLQVVNETEALIKEAATLINETATLISETITSVNETFQNINTSTTSHLKEICEFYEESEQFDLFRMADVWESKYYRVSSGIPCIRIHIKRTTFEERKFFLRKYGDFNGSLNWNNTLMEIKAREYEHVYRRHHFLNGFVDDRGVLDNVIIATEKNGDVKLLDETADQWLVVKNLLLMRDCANGEVNVFSKIPSQPRIEDLAEALEIFGEETMNGTMICEEINDII